MNTILFQPTDVLFFRDGRPMAGSLAGHSAAWPLPDVTNHALHAALHRARIEGVHSHRCGCSGVYLTDHRDRKFGCLTTAGPFPVRIQVNHDSPGPKGSAGKRCTWFFPRPADAGKRQSLEVTFLPIRPVNGDAGIVAASNSLPLPLRYATGNSRPPEKEADGERWISAEAFSAYLHGKPFTNASDFAADSDVADREAQLGIEINPATQTIGQGQGAGRIYTAHYLRLREDSDTRWSLGLFAEAWDKVNGGSSTGRRDLIEALFQHGSQRIVVGGQQRVCTAERWPTGADAPIRLPRGLSENFETTGQGADKRWLVKWVLLTPAVWPQIQADPSSKINAHPGGWLPNWVFVKWNTAAEVAEADDRNGSVLLTDGPGIRKSGRRGVGAGAGRRIAARLVAAIVPKPLTITGWALPSEEAERPHGGAKSTHLAVPAGAVYYFEAESEEAAASLAAALNWHGSTSQGTGIRNRRSTLLGEKGYGLGVCGTWNFFDDVAGRPAHGQTGR
jgi:CRISPR-associated protein Cmr3